MRVLVVEDEPDIASVLDAYLRRDGLRTAIAGDGFQALQLFRDLRPDMVLLDIHLPGVDGLDVLRSIRNAGQTPVILVTALADDVDKLLGLRLGADDYVIKPFNPAEVVARVRAVLRRTHPVEGDAAVLHYRDLELNEDSYEVHRAKHPVDLSPTEFKLLRYLMINAERVVSKMQILDHVWDYNWDGEISIVESYISYLRRKIDSPDALGITDKDEAQAIEPLIHTKRGIGYVLRSGK